MSLPRVTTTDVLATAVSTAQRTPGGCLLVTAWKPMAKGYVRVRADGRDVMIHRLVVEDREGRTLAANETVDHECHNDDLTCRAGNACPHRRCIEPSHLTVTGAVENTARGHGRGPDRKPRARRTHCPHKHPLAGANVRQRADGARECRACKRARASGRDPALEPVWDEVRRTGPLPAAR